MRACAGDLTGTLTPTIEPVFFSHTHTNYTSGRNVAHIPEGLESVRREGYRSVQVTRLPALLPADGCAMVKERRGLSTTAHARAHCTMPSFKHSFDGQQCVAGAAAIGHLRGMVGAGAIGQQRTVGAVAIGHPQRMGGSWRHRATA